MKKIIIPILSTLIIVTCIIVNNSKVINNNVEIKEDKTNSNLISIMLETEDNSGVYQTSTLSTWPTDGYKYNSQLSHCENGGTLTWDEETNTISYNGNKSEKCYIFFDVFKLSLSDYIISQYTGTQGDNNIYYHNSTITDDEENIIDAEDNSYRYAGTSADVKNYICLGSYETTCPEDNLYRIIGVFGDNNHGVIGQQLVKVIKNTTYGLYKWNTSKDNDWATSTLNETLNSTFISEKLSNIENEIAEVTWKVSGHKASKITVKTFYTAEITNATKTVTAKIGLMYVSDYGYAATSNYWLTNLYDYEQGAKDSDWLVITDVAQWTISPSPNYGYTAWAIGNSGSIGINSSVENSHRIFPSFYLNQSVQYIKGSGTISDSIYVK